MPSCQAYGCSNTSGKTPGKRSYYHFPNPAREKECAERWLHNIGTGHTINNFKFTRDKVVCSEHFHPSCFEVDKKGKLLGYEPKRRNLKPGAVPSIFTHKVYDVINIDGEESYQRATSSKRTKKREHDEVSLF